jgi:hypothetical protein
MPVRRAHDFQLNGKGFMLARGEYKGRAWQRTGRSDAPGLRSQTDARFGTLEDELDHPEVWDDWSGGFGYAYRRTGENTYHWAENFDARFPRQLVHAQQLRMLPAALASLGSSLNLATNCLLIHDSPVATFWATDPSDREGNGAVTLYCVNGVGVLRPTGASEASPFALLANLHPLMVRAGPGKSAIFGSYNYVPTSNASENLNQNSPYGAALGGGMFQIRGQFVARVGNRLWRGFGTAGQNAWNTLSSVAAGANPSNSDNWSAHLSVGDGYQSITDILGFEDQLFVGMPNGLYAGDQSGTFVNVLGELEGQMHHDNCRDLCVHDSQVIVPTQVGIFAYQSNGYEARARMILPRTFSNRSPIQGYVRALASYGGWLYGALWTGSQSYILAGMDRGDGQYVWHTQQRFPHVAKPHRLHFDGITVASGNRQIPNRFWVLTAASINLGGTAPVYWMPVPTVNGNPLAPNPVFTPNYCGSARIDLGSVDWGAPGTPKLYRVVEVWADNLASGAQWVRVYYSVDNEATRHLLGTAARSPKTDLYFPSGEGSFVTGQSIALSLESFTASRAITPIYRSIVLRGALQARSVDLITAVVRIGDGIRDRQGAAMRSGATMLRELRDLSNPDITPQAVQLIDLAGATQYVKLVGRVDEQETYQAGNDEPEVAATIKLAVMNYTGGPA